MWTATANFEKIECLGEDLCWISYVYDYNCVIAVFKLKKKPSGRRNIHFRMGFEIARELMYLHQECSTQIILCDIMPQNVLRTIHSQQGFPMLD